MLRHEQDTSALSRRQFIGSCAAVGSLPLAMVLGDKADANDKKKRSASAKSLAATAQDKVRTVLGPIEPGQLGNVLMHEHIPIVDWSELYETPAAPYEGVRDEMVARSTDLLQKFAASLPEGQGPGAVVECTPIRVGRYPDLMVEIAKKSKVHIIACTGFWGESHASQHPWAVRLSVSDGGIDQLAGLFIHEINDGMEDPSGEWGERFTDVRAGIIKCATSSFLKPSERFCHRAAAIASIETGCPITTHTTDGGGLEQLKLFLEAGVAPAKIIIGHQGNMDDRTNQAAHEYHRQIAGEGCYVQFDRVGHGKYTVENQAQQIIELIHSGHGKQVLVSHDSVPYLYPEFANMEKSAERWKTHEADFTICTILLKKALKDLGATDDDLRTIYVDNPQRVLAF
ncbi:MAG: phosphotriesterase [Planctomycetaceae bacterium]